MKRSEKYPTPSRYRHWIRARTRSFNLGTGGLPAFHKAKGSAALATDNLYAFTLSLGRPLPTNRGKPGSARRSDPVFFRKSADHSGRASVAAFHSGEMVASSAHCAAFVWRFSQKPGTATLGCTRATSSTQRSNESGWGSGPVVASVAMGKVFGRGLHERSTFAGSQAWRAVARPPLPYPDLLIHNQKA